VAGPVWLTGIFAALMLTVAVYCAGRLAVARRWGCPTELDTDAGHVLMGAAMAGMLVARLRILPAVTWEVVFAVGAAWFAWQLFQSRRRAPATWRCLHPAPHLVECGAMLYMFLVLPPVTGRPAAAGMAGIAGMGASAASSRYSFLALVLGLFMVGYVARTADRLPPGRTADRLPSGRTADPPRRPRLPARPAGPALPRSPLRRPLQDRHGPHHDLHAGPDALAPSPVPAVGPRPVRILEFLFSMSGDIFPSSS